MVAFTSSYAPAESLSRSKNRAGDFFWQGGDCSGKSDPQTRTVAGENERCSYDACRGSALPQETEQEREQRKKDCDLLVSRMKEMSSLWADSQRSLNNKEYGDFLVPNPSKGESQFLAQVGDNTIKESLTIAGGILSTVPGVGPFLGAGVSSTETYSKAKDGDFAGALSTSAGMAFSGYQYYLSETAAYASWRSTVSTGMRASGYAAAAYLGYKILWDPYVEEMARQRKPDQIVNPEYSDLKGLIRGAEAGIEFYSEKYNELKCQEFY